MKNKSFKLMFIIPVLAAVVLVGCAKKLDLTPTNDLTNDKVFATPLG